MIHGQPPVCLNCMSESECKYGDYCQFRHTETGEQPRKKSRKSGGKRISGPVFFFKKKNYSVWLCIPRLPSDCPQKDSILRKIWKIGIESHRQVLHVKIRGKKGPIAGNCSKCEFLSNIKNARRNPQTGAMRPQRSLGPGTGCTYHSTSNRYPPPKACFGHHSPSGVTCYPTPKRCTGERIEAQANWKPFANPGTP